MLAVSGAGGAVAATKLRTPEQENRAVLNDVAGQLGVTPERLSNAFKTALKNRIDQAVKDGHLTQAQADELVAGIKEHVTAMVNGQFERRREHHFGPLGPRGPPGSGSSFSSF